MQILGRKMMHNLVVLKTCKTKILGKDFIRKQALRINALTDKGIWETLPLDSGQLRAA
jgi:hypothetical protein